jgi:hypothetical protein
MMVFRSAYNVNRQKICLGFICTTYQYTSLNFGRNPRPRRFLKYLCGVTCVAHYMCSPFGGGDQRLRNSAVYSRPWHTDTRVSYTAGPSVFAPSPPPPEPLPTMPAVPPPWVISSPLGLEAGVAAGRQAGVAAVADTEEYAGMGQPRSVSIFTARPM